MTTKKPKTWKFKNAKRAWLNPSPELRAFINWNINGKEYKGHCELNSSLAIADCSRTVYLDFEFGEYHDRTTARQAQAKVDRFRSLMNEFCDQMEDAIQGKVEADKRVKKRVAEEKAKKKKKKK